MFKKKQATSNTGVRQRQPSAARLHRGATTAVFSYTNRAAGPTGRSPQQAQNPSPAIKRSRHLRLVQWAKRTPLVATVVVVGVMAILNSYVNPNPKLAIGGDQTSHIFLRPTAEYHQIAQQVLHGSILSRTKFTINTTKLAAQLQAQLPELAGVSIALPFFGVQPTVYITPATPEFILQTTSGGSYVIDERGRALIATSKVPQITKLGLPVVTDQSGLAVQLGKLVLPSSGVSYITEVAGQLKTQHVTIASMTLPPASSELDVRLSGAGYYVKFNLQGNAREEAGAYLAAIAQLTREHKTPGAYIDVRVPERAYYK